MSIPVLKHTRAEIDQIDDQIIDLLAQRFDVVHETIKIKTQHNIPATLQDRVDEVRNRNVARGKAKGLREDFVYDLYTFIIDYTCNYEDKVLPVKDKAPNPERAVASDDVFAEN